MTKIKISNRNYVEVYQWMTKKFGYHNDGANWMIVTYAKLSPETDETYLEIYQGDPVKITLAIIRWS